MFIEIDADSVGVCFGDFSEEELGKSFGGIAVLFGGPCIDDAEIEDVALCDVFLDDVESIRDGLCG